MKETILWSIDFWKESIKVFLLKENRIETKWKKYFQWIETKRMISERVTD